MNIHEVVNKGLCLGCGVCTYDDKIQGMKYSTKDGIFYPVLPNSSEDTEIANSICPGNGYNIIKDAKDLYGNNKYSLELGYFDALFAAHSKNKELLKNASSGATMPALLEFLLSKKIVDKVAVTKFIYTQEGPRTRTFLTDNISDILSSQGSKYCPVDISNVISEIKEANCKIAYLGTPCQVAGIRQIQKIDNNFRKNIVLTIANFCGGFKTFNVIRKISERHNISFKDIIFLRYRGGGQPGSMKIKDNNGNNFEASYEEYGGFTGYSKHLRCHLCVDATGELADISMGDAWLDKYLKDRNPWSIILTRTKFASHIINQMQNDDIIALEPISEQEVMSSQKQNLTSKKYRQKSRYKLYKLLGYKLPYFDGGYLTKQSSVFTEIIVFLKHRFYHFLEICGLYRVFRIIIRKPY